MLRTRFAIRLCFAGGFSSAIGFSAPALAADPKRPAAASKAGDWEITLSARKALWADAQLAPLNLGVTVADGVATVWGPVPSHPSLEEALARVRLVPGVREVISELYVVVKEEPKAASSTAHPTGQFLVPRVESPNYRGTVLSTFAAYLRDTSAVDIASAPASASKKPADSQAGRSVQLLPPVPVSPSNLPTQVQIEQLRVKDGRYRNLRIEFKEGHVTVYGTVARNRDAWDFADVVRQINGVTNVTLKLSSDGP